MKPNDKIEKTLMQFDFDIDAEQDQQVLDKLLREQGSQPQAKQHPVGLQIFALAVRSRFAQLAAAAVIIIAVGLFMVPSDRNGPVKKQKIAQSPAQMVTVASLNAAWRQGGLEAAEQLSRRALKGAYVSQSNMRQLQQEFSNHNGI